MAPMSRLDRLWYSRVGLAVQVALWLLLAGAVVLVVFRIA